MAAILVGCSILSLRVSRAMLKRIQLNGWVRLGIVATGLWIIAASLFVASE